MSSRKKIKRRLLQLVAVKAMQPFFKKLHWIALRGMNYGNADTPEASGEKFLLQYIQAKRNNKDLFVFDVGANKGQYALMAQKLVRDATIYSFEPTKRGFEKLTKNTEAYTTIKTFPFGLGPEKKSLSIFYNDPASVLSTLVGKEGFKHEETINIITLDQFCKEHIIEHIDLLKIDVEGYEFDVLLGCKNMLQIGAIEIIQFEFGNRQVQSKNFLREFIDLLDNYQVYRLIQNGFVKIERDPIFEIFQTTNYVAIRKENLPLT